MSLEISEGRIWGSGEILSLDMLKNKTKRDPESYREDFIVQWQRIKRLLDLLLLDLKGRNDEFIETLQFVSHVAHLYPDISHTLPNDLIFPLKEYFSVMLPETRLAIVNSIISLKTNNLISYEEVIPLFMSVLRCNDKTLRRLISGHILRSIKTSCSKNKNYSYSNYIRKQLFNVLDDENEVEACRVKVLEIIICTFTKGIWKDVNTVNTIANAVFSKSSHKLSLVALRFFLGLSEYDEDGDPLNEYNDNNGKDVTSVKHSMKVGKITGSKKRLLKRLESRAKKKNMKDEGHAFASFAIQLINNPYDFAEKLLSRAKKSTTVVPFETRLLCLDLFTRVINMHKLILVQFYEYILQYLRHSQKEVSSLLAFTARTSHEQVPPNLLSPILKTIANNFVWNSLSSEIVASGLNAIRLICTRCPGAMPEDLLDSLIEDYKSHKDKATRDAARSLLNLYRSCDPKVLKKKNRGKEASMSISRVNMAIQAKMQNAPKNIIAELMHNKNVKGTAALDSDNNKIDNINDGSDIEDSNDGSDIEDINDGFVIDDSKDGLVNKNRINIDPVTEILTNEKFEQLKELQGTNGLEDQSSSDDESNDEITEKDIIKNAMRKKDYEARMESVLRGREGRVYKSNKSLKVQRGGTTNKFKAKKNKNFAMARVEKRKFRQDNKHSKKSKRAFGKKKK